MSVVRVLGKVRMRQTLGDFKIRRYKCHPNTTSLVAWSGTVVIAVLATVVTATEVLLLLGSSRSTS